MKKEMASMINAKFANASSVTPSIITSIDSLSFDARVAAAAYGYAELLDRLRFGNLPANIASEILLDQASQAAVAVSAKPGRWPIFWQALAKLDRNKTNKNSEQEQQIVLFVAAIAQGWQAKWSD